jgi:hypothetical protein
MRSLAVVLFAAILAGCFFGSEGSRAKLVGTWDQSFSAFVTTSVHFDNKEGIDTYNPYDRWSHMDSNSCKDGDSVLADTSYNKRGTWQFLPSRQFVEGYEYRFPQPVISRDYRRPQPGGNPDTAAAWETRVRTGKYAIEGDILWLIFSTIEITTVRTRRGLRFSGSGDTLELMTPDDEYVHGNCRITSGSVEYLFRRR